jgi:hypothetical protein
MLDSDHLPFHILDHVKTKDLSEPAEKFTDWERFQSLASDLISPRIEINLKEEADKAVRNFTASVASTYRLLTKNASVSDTNNHDLPGSDRWSKRKQRLRKLWQETQDPECKMTIKWVKETTRKITCSKALKRWETKLESCEVTLQAIWCIAKSLMKRGEPKSPTDTHCPSGLKYHLLQKVNTIHDCLGTQFISHDLCDDNRRAEARVQALLEAVDNNHPEIVRPRDIQKLINPLKLRKACGIRGIPNEYLRHPQKRPLVH